MAIIQTLVAVLTGALLATLVFVLVGRRRYRYGYAFTAYVAAQLAFNLAYLIVPDTFDDWVAWAAKEILYALLRFAVLAETVTLIFRVLPRARARAQMLILIAAAVLVVLIFRPFNMDSPYRLARDITTRFSYITIWSLIAILGLVAWHRVPLLRFHKAILHGLLWLLLASFATVVGAGHFGHGAMGLTFNLFQLSVLGMWVLVAARDEVAALGKDERAVIRYLQPWRET